MFLKIDTKILHNLPFSWSRKTVFNVLHIHDRHIFIFYNNVLLLLYLQFSLPLWRKEVYSVDNQKLATQVFFALMQKLKKKTLGPANLCSEGNIFYIGYGVFNGEKYNRIFRINEFCLLHPYCQKNLTFVVEK